MNAVIVWSLFLLLIFSMAYVMTHKAEFDTIRVRGNEYYGCRPYTTHYGGKFKTPGYKLRHNAVIFAEDVDAHGFTERLLVIDTEFKDFVRVVSIYSGKANSIGLPHVRRTAMDSHKYFTAMKP